MAIKRISFLQSPDNLSKIKFVNSWLNVLKNVEFSHQINCFKTMSFIYEEPSFKQGHRFILNKYLVKDSLKSLTVANSNLGLLHFGNVIVRRDYATYEYVKIISGGPSGHEPAHAGYVGKGMLTAAIQGELCNTIITIIYFFCF